MKKVKDFLKDKGVKLVQTTNKVIDKTKETIKDTLLYEHLRRRFQLEYPHKMIVSSEPIDVNIITELRASHAKIYEDDNVFVFFGDLSHNQFIIGDFVKDLATLETYKIKDIAEVEIPVTLNDVVHEVKCTAVYCEGI